MDDIISQSKFAKLVGTSQQSISKLIKTGKITTINGKVVKSKALKEYQIHKLGTPKVVFSSKQRNDFDVNSESEDDGKKLLKAKAEKETQLAELNRLKVEKEHGRLIEIEDVLNQCNKAMEIVRNELLNLPSRIALVLEGKTAHEIQLKLEDEINHAMQSLFDLGKQYQLEKENQQIEE